MDPVTGQLILAGGQAVISGAQQQQQRLDQRRASELSFHQDIAMWDMANRYNAPSAQMQRLKDAGLNPNLVYGSGSVVGNTTTQTPKYQAFNPAYNTQPVQLPNLLAVLNQYQDLKSKQAVTDNVMEQNKSIKLDNLQKDLNVQFLSETLPDRTTHAYEKMMLTHRQAQKGYFEKEFLKETLSDRIGRFTTAYQLDMQKLKQEQRMNDIDFIIKQVAGSMARYGLSKSDSAFLRAISLTKEGFSGGKEIMPYVIGEGVAKFGGDLLKTATPKLPFQKFKFNSDFNSDGYRKIPRK